MPLLLFAVAPFEGYFASRRKITMMAALDRLFHLTANGTTVRTEILAGVTTFLTMAYIIFVQPAILSGTLFGIRTGMDFGAVMTATCV